MVRTALFYWHKKETWRSNVTIQNRMCPKSFKMRKNYLGVLIVWHWCRIELMCMNWAETVANISPNKISLLWSSSHIYQDSIRLFSLFCLKWMCLFSRHFCIILLAFSSTISSIALIILSSLCSCSLGVVFFVKHWSFSDGSVLTFLPVL